MSTPPSSTQSPSPAADRSPEVATPLDAIQAAPPAELTDARGVWGSRHQIRTLVLLLATGMGVYFCLRLTAPFLAALTWSLALAVLFAPLHRHLEAKLKRPNLTATISVVAAALILLLVVAFIGERLLAEVVKGAAVLKTKVESGDWARALESHPYLAPIGRWIEENTDLAGAVKAAASWLATKGASIVQGSVIQLGGLLLTFYFLFFFLRDRRKARHALRTFLPLPPGALDRIGQRVVDTIHATFYGTLAVAAVQGTLGGLMFWALGLSAPVLWGVMMGLLAVVPVLGAFIVWIPAAVILALGGSWIKAIVLTAWGTIVVGGIDNLLYPILVGNRLQMHTAIAFIAMLGGLMVLGASGIILGPLAVTITGALLELWRHRKPDATDSPATAPMSEDTRE